MTASLGRPILVRYAPTMAFPANCFAYPNTGYQAAATELKATMAERRDAALAANLSPSTETRGPSTVMTYGRSGVCGASVMVAARARPVASRINAIEMRRRIEPLSPLERDPSTGAESASIRDSRRWASGAMPLGHDARVPAALTGPRERLDDL